MTKPKKRIKKHSHLLAIKRHVDIDFKDMNKETPYIKADADRIAEKLFADFNRRLQPYFIDGSIKEHSDGFVDDILLRFLLLSEQTKFEPRADAIKSLKKDIAR